MLGSVRCRDSTQSLRSGKPLFFERQVIMMAANTTHILDSEALWLSWAGADEQAALGSWHLASGQSRLSKDINGKQTASLVDSTENCSKDSNRA
jgi:hypothetical protein